MITLETRKVVFDTICNGIRYWISFENSNCAASFIYMSSQLPLSGFERSSLARLIQIFDAVFPNTPYESLTNTLNSANIPDKYQLNVETAFSYVMLQMVINFLNAKLFSEVITFLVTSTENWKEFYSRAIAEIATNENCEAFCKWCATDSVLALDVKKTTILDYGNLAIIFSENGFSDIRDTNVND